MGRTLFRGGTVVTEAGMAMENLLVEDGVVVARGDCVDASAAPVSCEGLWLLPGVVDPHVHFALECNGISTADTVVTASRSAVAGGVTTVADFVEHQGSLRQSLARHIQHWQGAACDWALHSMITRFDAGVESELRDCAAEGVIRSVKLFTTYRTQGLYADDEVLYRVICASADGNAVALVHAENDGMVTALSRRAAAIAPRACALAWSRPAEAEEEAVFRVLTFARHSGGRVHLVHLSCPESAYQLASARTAGVWASGETCPHYLLLDEDVFAGAQGHWYATVPPIRSAGCADSLWGCLTRGDIQIVATDSCAYTTEAKDSWGGDFTRIPGGLPGVEVSLRMIVGCGVQAGRMSATDLVRIMSSNPARMLGIYPRKGSLSVGSDADIVLLDPEARAPVDAHALTSRAGWSPYGGFMAAMPPERVYLRGTLVASRGRYIGEDTVGRPLRRDRPICPV